MSRFSLLALSLAVFGITGCTPARFEFGLSDRTPADALPFYDPAPHLLVTVSADCTVASQVVAIPGPKRWVRLKPGQGASDLSLGFGNGLLTSVGQKSDTKVPETIGAVASVAGAVGAIVKAQGVSVTPPPSSTKQKAKACPPQAYLYPISDGAILIDNDKLKNMAIKQEQ